MAIAGTQKDPIPAPVHDIVAPESGWEAGQRETAVFAGGCFWGVQSVFQRVKGVEKTVVGYSGGAKETADYHRVSTGRTGHAEALEIVFDPEKVSFGTLLRVFFSVVHDPTQMNRQGNDVGTQYRSAIFYTDEEQREVAEAYVKQLDAGAYLSAAHRDADSAAGTLLRRRGVPPGLRDQEPAESVHPGLRYPQDRGAGAAVSGAFSRIPSLNRSTSALKSQI